MYSLLSLVIVIFVVETHRHITTHLEYKQTKTFDNICQPICNISLFIKERLLDLFHSNKPVY